MLPMQKGIFESKEMVVVVLVIFLIELHRRSAKEVSRKERETYQVKYGHLHHTLVEVGRLILHHLHSHHFLGLEVLALHHLSESTLPEYIENQVSVA
jgi:hypothetical protein